MSSAHQRTTRALRSAAATAIALLVAGTFGLFVLDDTGTALPPGFVRETVVQGLDSPIDVEFAPNGLIYVTEFAGRVRVIENGQLRSAPFIDLRPIVNLAENRGLLGLAVHPDFPATPYIYLNYTYDPPETNGAGGRAGRDGGGQRVSRLSRVTADANNGYRTAVPNSEFVLVGRNSTWQNIAGPGNAQEDSTGGWTCYQNFQPFGTPVQDCMPADGRSHAIGAVEFGTDGSLFFSNGDASSFVVVDDRAMRAQDLDSLTGKIMRIDPITGEGLSDNPFYNGDPDANRSKVYNYGLRNPYRFTIDPVTNQPWIGDVGWFTTEEINSGRGRNFGWPCFEGAAGGNTRTPQYQSASFCQSFYPNNNATPPTISWGRQGGGGAAIGGPILSADQGAYPAAYDSARFYGDYVQGWIRYRDANGVDRDFETGLQAFVDLELGPDGNLYYLELLEGRLYRIRSTENNGNFTTIRSAGSNKCMDIEGASNAAGARDLQFGCNGQTNQDFEFERVDTGYYRIIARHSGLCLEVPGSSQSTGRRIEQATCDGGENQQFQIRPSGSKHELIARHSGKCLGVRQSSNADLEEIIQRDCNGADHRRWFLTPPDNLEQPPTNSAPVLGNLSNRTNAVGTSVLFTVGASDPDDDELTFAATGLPPGVQLRPRLGEIGGTLGTAGTFTVSITVSDGNGGSDTDSFTWTVNQGGGDAVGEVGKLTTFQRDAGTWQTVQLQQSYDEPVVVMGAPTLNGSDPLAMRVRNVTSNSFEFQFDEWDYLDGSHTNETIGYVVLEAGTHTLADGSRVVAARDSSVGESDERQGFPFVFPRAPAVFSQVASDNDSAAVTTRHSQLYRASFRLRIQDEEQPGNNQTHGNEAVHWMAFELVSGTELEVDRTGNSVTDQTRGVGLDGSFNDPVVLAQMQSRNGTDTATTRISDVRANRFNVHITEERSRDTETAHGTESIGFAVFNRPGLLN